ncbi:MAG TPA: hypothetical protein VFO69_10135 [Allosphingosinicella sp.]|nr:hypothetical protein [Allosphingosinicella sp.]
MAETDRQTSKIVSDPSWLAHRYDSTRDAVHFIRASRQEHRAATFLTDEFLPGHARPIGLDRSDSVAASEPGTALHFIFHSAYCCSTLLARALDVEGVAFALKEPVILNDISGWRRRGGAPADLARSLDSALTLLARPFAANEAVIIKPSNLVNPFIPVMLRMRPNARAILLHAPLRAYLGSIARKGMWGRLWVRELFVKIADGGLLDYGFSSEEVFRQTDLQIAAIGWLGQHRLFAALAQRHPDRVRTLDSERFMADVEQTLARLGHFFDLDIDASAVAAGEAFKRHSKGGAEFSAEERRADQRDAAMVHAEEIDKVATWAEAVAASAGQPLRLPLSLLDD